MKIPYHIVNVASLLLISLSTLSIELIGQVTFQKTYGHIDGNEANSVIATEAGGYAIAGWYDVDGLFSAEFYLVATDAVGDTLWTQTYGSAAEGNAHSVNGSGNEGYHLMQTDDGGFLFVGERHFVAGGQSDAYVIKLSRTGKHEWSKIYGGLDNDYGYKAIQTEDGGYVIGGFTESYGSGIRDMYLFKIDSLGELLWHKTYGGDSIDAAFDLTETDDGGFVLVGYTFSFSGSSDVYAIRTDALGQIIWQKTYGGELNDIGHSIIRSQEGGYLIAGETESYGQGGADLYLIKIDTAGGVEWSSAHGGDDYDTGRSITQSSNGDYAVAGYTRSIGAGGEDAYIAAFDNQGNLRWVKTFGGQSDDQGRSILGTEDGGYIMAGYTKSYGAGFSDMYLIKTESNGESSCEQDDMEMQSVQASTLETLVTSAISEGMTVITPSTRVGNTSTQISDPCEISSTEESIHGESGYTLVPNPATDRVTITPLDDAGSVHGHASIYNSLGQRVLSQQLSSHRLDLSDILPGIYMVILQIEHQTFSYTLVKN